ncbi:MAG TPA: hypothetical protein VJ801_18525 [Polyangia bacterium]|nr:hypothetical protein [Polyangia bacterium]
MPDERANQPKVERRPKVGDRVKIFEQGQIFVVTFVGQDYCTARKGNSENGGGFTLVLCNRGVTWDFADEEPAKGQAMIPVQFEVHCPDVEGGGDVLVLVCDMPAVPCVGDEVEIGDTNLHKVVAVTWTPPDTLPAVWLGDLDDEIGDELLDKGWQIATEK